MFVQCVVVFLFKLVGGGVTIRHHIISRIKIDEQKLIFFLFYFGFFLGALHETCKTVTMFYMVINYFIILFIANGTIARLS